MEGKHGTACQRRLIGTWPTTGDGGRVDQVFHAGADEADAEQVAAVVIDDPAGSAGVAVGVQAGSGTAWPGSTSITRMRYPARSAWSAMSPTALGGRVAEEYLRHGVVVGGDGPGAEPPGTAGHQQR